jgi:hypothetical protein
MPFKVNTNRFVIILDLSKRLPTGLSQRIYYFNKPHPLHILDVYVSNTGEDEKIIITKNPLFSILFYNIPLWIGSLNAPFWNRMNQLFYCLYGHPPL